MMCHNAHPLNTREKDQTVAHYTISVAQSVFNQLIWIFNWNHLQVELERSGFDMGGRAHTMPSVQVV